MSDVLINGYGDCAIKSNSVRRVATEQRTLNSQVFHKCAIGTTTKGIAYHWYPASRVTVINKPLPEIKMIDMAKFRLRKRQWKRHPALVKTVCRRRIIIKAKGIAT